MAAPALGVLTKEVGAGPLKLPLGLWAVAGVGGVLLARKIAASQAASSDASTSGAGAALPDGGSLLTLGTNGAVAVPGGAIDTTTASTITDNNAWRIAAEAALIANGYDALLAAAAIDNYLNGVVLTTQQQGAVAYAIQRIGPTPEPVPPPIIPVPSPTPTPTPKPPPTATPITQATPYYAKPALAPNHLAGEAFVDFANSPNRGTWWLTNWGGVYAVGGAPYKGSMITYRVAPKLGSAPSGQTAVSISPDGAGYVIADNWPNTGSYAFP